jgi:hypothetical protein
MPQSKSLKRVNSVDAEISSTSRTKKSVSTKKTIIESSDENDTPRRSTRSANKQNTYTNTTFDLSKNIDKSNQQQQKHQKISTKSKSKKNASEIATNIADDSVASGSVAAASKNGSSQHASNEPLISARSVEPPSSVPSNAQEEIEEIDINNNQVDDIEVLKRDAQLLIKGLVLQAEKNKFPMKEFFFDDVRKKYTPILNFFEHQIEFNKKPKGGI